MHHLGDMLLLNVSLRASIDKVADDMSQHVDLYQGFCRILYAQSLLTSLTIGGPVRAAFSSALVMVHTYGTLKLTDFEI